MNRELAKHLWKSPAVREAVAKELLHLLVYMVVGIGSVACFRYLRGKPVAEGVLSESIGMIGVMLLWLITAVRTLRATLREHGYLER